MSKIAVVYWSGTGNTEAMANAVAEGIGAAGGESTLFTATEFDADKMDGFDAVAFGCPSMGSEELEDSEFLPMFESVEAKAERQEDRPVRLLRLGRRRMDAELERPLRRRRSRHGRRFRHLQRRSRRRSRRSLQGPGRRAGLSLPRSTRIRRAPLFREARRILL